MNFESLANELFFDLFEYLNINDLFNGFYNLNHRLNKLLFIHIQLHGHVNFDSISKTNFDIICHEYLPNHLDQIHSIHLSDNDETPKQINYFLSYYNFHFQQFISLKILSLHSISSEQIMTKILHELQELHHLTCLKIDQCHIEHDIINNGSIFDQIWNLSHLTHLDLRRKKFLWNPFLISPKIFSLTIRYLYLEGFSYDSDELEKLFLHTIHLENLTIDIEHNHNDQQVFSSLSSLKKLKIFIQYSPYIINNLCQYMTNLTHLTMDLAHMMLDGNQWEKMISNQLIYLKKLQFKMEFYLRCNDNDRQQQINQILNTFRSSFWIVEHQWYIQCHWDCLSKSSKAYFYTIPYYSKEFSMYSNLQFQTTYPNNEIHWSFNSVENLTYRNSICHLIRFNNIIELKLELPIDETFWLIIPNLNRLISLNVKSSNNADQLKNLLEKTTNLYSLTLIGNISTDDKILFNLKNFSIRQLNLYKYGYFNDDLCEYLINSSLGSQCEILFIYLNHRNSILNLINRMKNLRVLNARCDNDELTHCSNDFFPKNCIVKRKNFHDICIWIR